MQVAAAEFDDEQAVQASEGNDAVHVEGIGAEHGRGLRMQECRQVVSVCRPSVGGFFCAVRTRRIVDTLTRWPSFSSSPWTRWYPQPWFSIARRSMTTVIPDWQDQADAKISADYSWRRGVFESTGWHRGNRLIDLGAAAARRRSEAGVQIGRLRARLEGCFAPWYGPNDGRTGCMNIHACLVPAMPAHAACGADQSLSSRAGVP